MPVLNFRARRAAIATALSAAMLLTATACATEDSRQNAVAVGGTFTFVSPGGETVVKYAPEERKPVAEFSGEDLMEPNKTINLSDFKDQVVVLNAWGQWCAPCRSESDDLQRVQETMQERDLGTLLGINVRDTHRQKPQDFVTDNGLTYPSIYDPPFKTAARLGGIPASVIPTTIVLDKQHRPAVVFLQEVTDKQLLEAVEEVAAEG
ncbi:TlpA disulfide reductase family protein [Corynebacterium ulceribovis]|uniref:TlpA disulfide reductase family protein n=1 Tax=Corynebacterium ulceribovis TaxID=487732 RepID=UPI0003650852|nr:TlpA disulfide reductase family protein [Corynebacterium ulceribovis]